MILTLIAAIVDAFVTFAKQPQQPTKRTMTISRVVFSAIAGFASFVMGFSLPWAAVCALLAYAIMQGDAHLQLLSVDVTKLVGASLQLITVGFSAACAIQLTTLHLTAPIPVFVGAVVFFGTNCRGSGAVVAQAWVPIAIGYAVVWHTRVYYLLALLLAIASVWCLVGQHLDFVEFTNKKFANVYFVLAKIAAFVVVLVVFQPFDATQKTFGHPIAAKAGPCVRRDDNQFTTDLQGTPCVQFGAKCPLSFNPLAQAELVCGGIGQGVCISVEEGKTNVCHCEAGYCGDVKYFPQYQKYFYVGCSTSFLSLYGNSSCGAAGQPPNDLPESAGDRDLRPEFACRCVCDDVSHVGPLCNATCPVKDADADVCNGYPCMYNATTGKAECDCLGQAQGTVCDQQACSGHGELSKAGTCNCDDGFGGYNCNVSCPHCSGHGQCTSRANCTCAAGWLPPDCAKCDDASISSQACGQYGVCTDGECKCLLPGLSSASACQKCIDKNAEIDTQCATCAEGFYNSSDAGCQPCTDCNFSNCTSDGNDFYTCDCPPGFSGPQCQCPPECAATGGTCTENGACLCEGKCVTLENTCGESCSDTDPCGGIATGPTCCEPVTGMCRCNGDPQTGQCTAPG